MTYTIQWDHSSQWATAHVSEWYSQPLAIPDSGVYEFTFKVTQDGLAIVLTETIQCFNWVVGVFSLGICTMQNNEDKTIQVKRYCQYVIDCIVADGHLGGLPMNERLEDWDDL